MIRRSLDFRTFTYKAQCLKYAADQNLKLFLLQFNKKEKGDNEYRNVALYNSSMLLYAVSVENLLKAIGLFRELDLINSGKIRTFREFMKKWKDGDSGHNYSKLIDYYNIEISEDEDKVLSELQNFSIWAGRFPFPLIDSEIDKFESNLRSPGKLNAKYENILSNFIERFLKEMDV